MCLEFFDGTVKSTVHIWKRRSPRKFAANVKGQWGGRSRAVPSWACWSEKYQIHVNSHGYFQIGLKFFSVIFFRFIPYFPSWYVLKLSIDLCPSTPTFLPNLREAGLLTSLKVTSEVNNKNSIKQPVEVVGRCCQGVRRRRQGKWIVRSVASSRATDPRPRPGFRVLLQVVHDIIILSFQKSQNLFVVTINLHHLSAKNWLNSSSDVPRVTRWLRSWSGWWDFSLLANLDEWWDLLSSETTC